MHDSILVYHVANQKLKAAVGALWCAVVWYYETYKYKPNSPASSALHLYWRQEPSSRFRFEQFVTTCVDEADEDSSDELECRRA